MLYDTHCHLDYFESNDKIREVIEEAKKVGVRYLMNAGVYVSEIDREIEICEKFNDSDFNIICAVANHPENIRTTGVITTEELKQVAIKNKYIKAIGETGLDTHRPENYDFLNEQIKSFENHIEVAIELKLPLIVHAYGKDAIEKSVDIVCQIAKKTPFKVVMHCYDGDYEQAKKIVDIDGYISKSGTATFKKPILISEVVAKIPIEKLVIETDAPYLAPAPVRGQTNCPAFLQYTAKFISDFLHIDYEEFCKITTENGMRLFNQK